MGEIADMMLEGDLCEGCGVALDGEGYGVPRYCSDSCAQDRGFDGVQSDGAGTFKKSKKKVFENCLSIKITNNGRQLFDDRKNLKYKGVGFQESKEFAKEVRELADKYFASKAES